MFIFPTDQNLRYLKSLANVATFKYLGTKVTNQNFIHEGTGTWEKLQIWSSINYSSPNTQKDDQIKDRMGRTYSMLGGDINKNRTLV